MLKDFFKINRDWFRRISVRSRIIYAFASIAAIMGGSILILSIFQRQTLESLNHVIEVDSRSDRLMMEASARVVHSRLDLLRFIKDYLPSTANALENARRARALLKEVDGLAKMRQGNADLNDLLPYLDEFIQQIEGVQKAQQTKGHPESVRMAFLASKTGHDIGQRIERIVAENQVHMKLAVGEAQSHARNRLILYSTGYIVILCFAFILSVFLAKSITRPVRSLGRAARAFQKGNFETLAPVSGRDELTILAKTFNTMAGRLRLSFAELREYQDSLEEKVSLRTREISLANDQLKTEIRIRREIEKALQKAKNDAEAANRAKGEFLANMSHEIRTPMNGIMGMTRFLLDSDLDRVQQDYAEHIKTSSEALMGILNDILDFSKIEAGKLEFDERDFDLRTILEDITGFLGVKAHEKQLEIGCFLDPSAPFRLSGDPGRLRQIILNLAVNAIKFTRNGEIAIRVTQERETRDHSVFLFRIIDSGIGIPRDKLDRLFKSFSQVDTSTTRRFGGTGLGLIISKRLTEMMGGQINVRSKVGEGSEFWFTARLKKQSESACSPDLIPSEIRGSRILAIEANPLNREILTQYLTTWGYNAIVIKNLTAEANLLDSNTFDVVMVEEAEAGALMQKTQKDPDLKDIPLVLITHNDLGQTQIEEMGFSHGIKKPIRPSALYTILLRLLAQESDSGLRNREAERSEERSPMTLPAAGGLRILLVEDNPVNQQVALIMLKKNGYGADLAVNGKEAVKAVQKAEYDLILMDIQMPELDGFQATRIIRSLGEPYDDIPIIAMTANAMKGDREKCLAAGLTDYIVKPINPKQLYNAIAAVTKRSVA